MMDRSTIRRRLEEMQHQHGVKILYACESGSRAWGFASPDSDYDVRFVYIRPLADYLSIVDIPDTIEAQDFEEDFDAVGWDIKKVLGQTWKSNANLYEWFYSPIVYWDDDNSANVLRRLAKSYFCEKRVMQHYLGLAKKYQKAVVVEQVKLKSYFYLLRAVYCAEWVRKFHSQPPVLLQETRESLCLTRGIDPIIEDWLMLKAKHNEKYCIDRNEHINQILSELMNINQSYVNSIEALRSKPDELNAYFYQRLNVCT